MGLRAVTKKVNFDPMPNLSVGKNIVQLNYEWNNKNTYPWKNTPGVKYYHLSLDKFPELKAKMKITSVPTILVLENGKEIKRYEGGMMMKVSVPQAEIIK
jgi:thiol-disulfide isomerase/thioredoxin